jgi:hypothetical protein
MTTSGLILDRDYVKEGKFATANKIARRTVARMRQEGLPYLMWAGEIYIHVPGARDYLRGRIKRRTRRKV